MKGLCVRFWGPSLLRCSRQAWPSVIACYRSLFAAGAECHHWGGHGMHPHHSAQPLPHILTCEHFCGTSITVTHSSVGYSTVLPGYFLVGNLSDGTADGFGASSAISPSPLPHRGPTQCCPQFLSYRTRARGPWSESTLTTWVSDPHWSGTTPANPIGSPVQERPQ